MITESGFIKHDDFIAEYEEALTQPIKEIICPHCKRVTRVNEPIGNLWECLECGETWYQ
jgi:ribosomal protein L37AE/L43A